MVPPPLLKFFYSTNDVVTSGDNMGTIYNPCCLTYTGADCQLEAGQSALILPFQDDKVSPWKTYKSALFDHRFVRNKNARNLCFVVTNKWVFRAVTIPHGIMLNVLLAHPGIHHTMGYMSAYDLLHLKERNQVQMNNDEEEFDEEDQNDAEPEQSPAGTVTQLASASRMVSASCHHSCCHHVDIIRP
jgi:hypothetical protein